MEPPKIFSLGRKVKWFSSYYWKHGHIVEVVPAGKLPHEVGYPKVAATTTPRDHDSYLVEAYRMDQSFWHGLRPACRKPKIYWPKLSLLEALD